MHFFLLSIMLISQIDGSEGLYNADIELTAAMFWNISIVSFKSKLPVLYTPLVRFWIATE